SFAYLVYASSWLKVHHPEAFYAALLAAQPMGFYSPQSLVADARRHGVRVLRADVQHSQPQATVERSLPAPAPPTLSSSLAPTVGSLPHSSGRNPALGERRTGGGARGTGGGAREAGGGASDVPRDAQSG